MTARRNLPDRDTNTGINANTNTGANAIADSGILPSVAQIKNALTIKNIFFLCFTHWKWFLISLAIALGCAYLYLGVTPSIYNRNAAILLKGDDSGNGSEGILKDLGVEKTSVNINNEISSLKTNTIVSEVVNRLSLDVEYRSISPLIRRVIYGVQCPVVVKFIGLNDSETVKLTLDLKADGRVKLSNIVSNGKTKYDDISMNLGDTCNTALCTIVVTPSAYYRKGDKDHIEVRRNAKGNVVNSIVNRLFVKLRDKNSTILKISLNDESATRAEDILNTLISIYNENGIKERNQRMVSANEFIKDRLEIIEQELGDVENVISNYKSDNLMPDVGQAGAMAVSQASTNDQAIRELDDQIYMIRYIRGYLTDGMHENQLLPANSGLNGSNLINQIAEYNEVMLQRNNHLANSSAQNPLVIDLNQHLKSMRQIIIQSLDNEQNILKARRANIQMNKSAAVAKIASNPRQAKFLLSVERQQKVKESLYLFLLQKREENELSQAFTTSGMQLLESPRGSSQPCEPVAKMIYFIALCVGLALPAAVILLREMLNTKVRGRKDMEGMLVPFVGEIPYAGEKLPTPKKLLKMLKHQKDEGTKQPELHVKDMSRNAMNEAFRILRTNLEFMLGYEGDSKVIMLTSLNPGAGKTFISANLAAVLGLKEKRVLLMDLDLRRGSLSKYVGAPIQGISNYLSGQENDYHHMITRLDSIDVLPCGTFPPNPTELLSSKRFSDLIEELRRSYDYVMIDCPPVEIVADTKIINRVVDMTLFVVRAQLLQRSFLPVIDSMYVQKQYVNLAVMLNGTEMQSGSYAYRRYGYYGYGYYGYGYGEENGATDNGKKKKNKR